MITSDEPSASAPAQPEETKSLSSTGELNTKLARAIKHFERRAAELRRQNRVESAHYLDGHADAVLQAILRLEQQEEVLEGQQKMIADLKHLWGGEA